MAKGKSAGIGLAKDAPAMPTTQAVQEKKWRAEEDLRTLRRAEEVKSDPARMNYAKRIAQQEVAALKRISGRK